MFPRFDPMARLLGLSFAGRTAAGVVTAAQVERWHLNPYRIAHGAFAYTMGCVTAQLAAELCLGRKTEIAGVSCQYLSALTPGRARCESELVFDSGTDCTYRVYVENEAGQVCFSQLVTLRPASGAVGPRAGHPRTIFPAPEDALVDPVTKVRAPLLSPGPYCEMTRIYYMGRRDEWSVMAADILPETCDEYGAAHCGLVYSVCDSGVGAASQLTGKMAVTVSSAVEYFRPAAVGPVSAEVRCVRDGHTVTYFRATARDGNGDVIAEGQFTMHPKAELTKLVEQEIGYGI